MEQIDVIKWTLELLAFVAFGQRQIGCFHTVSSLCAITNWAKLTGRWLWLLNEEEHIYKLLQWLIQ